MSGLGHPIDMERAVICRKLRVQVLVFCVTGALLGSVAASADEVKVMISGAFASAYRALGPQFEQAAGDTLVTVWGPVVGTAANAIPVRLARGEWADVLIVVGYALDDQVNAGKVVFGSKVDFARSAIGIAAREGAPKPDISSVDALRRTLLAAKSIVYPDDANGVYIGSELFRRLGIEERVESKSRMIPSEWVANVVANGEAEIGFQQIVELLPVDGVTVVGNLPAEVQRYTVFSGGISTNAKNPAGAAALIRFLSSPDAAPAIEGTGLEPLTPKTAN
ncbi:substrate-binding domain-containing protein [Paraburkholderia madseniana]|uniref:substrate-binding domain-containing protein n=1 Tax=Paraburkholderia madseniana TaxID=2599607 RepID=UPI001F2B3699|nr:substrate-binding domain-containing protein [Paraburkholderia madseniana]